MFRDRYSSDDPEHHRAIQGHRDVHPNGRGVMTLSARASHSCVEQSEGTNRLTGVVKRRAARPKNQKNENPSVKNRTSLPPLDMSPKQEVCEAPQHRALVIESNDEAARYIKHVLHTLGHSSCRAENSSDASRLICEANFCFVLLGLELKAEKTSELALEEVGQRLTEKLSRLLRTKALRTEILVLSEQGGSVGHVIRLMRLGANDVLRLPMNSNEPNLEDRIARSLRATGRESHSSCIESAPTMPNQPRSPPGYHCQLRSEGPGKPLLMIECAGRVRFDGVEIPISPRCGRMHLGPQPLAVLRLLAQHLGKSMTQPEIDGHLNELRLLRDTATDLSAIKYRILEPIRKALNGRLRSEIGRLIHRPRGGRSLTLREESVVYVSENQAGPVR